MNRIFWIPSISVLAACGLAAPAALSATCTIPNTVANGQVADASKVMENFTALANCAQEAVTTTSTPTTGSIAAFSGSGSITSGNLTGDVVTSGGTSTTLSNSGVAAGSYSNANITVDAKGRVTSATSGAVGSGAMVLLSTQIVTNSATAEFANAMSSTYDDYIMEFVDLALSDNGASLEILFSTNNGVTWDTGSNYDTAMFQTNQLSFSSNASLSGAGYGQLTQGYSNTSSNSFNGRLELYNTANARHKFAIFQSTTYKSDGYFYHNSGSIRYKNTAQVNAFKIVPSSGTITSGFIRLYALLH